jgi:serine/threonine-protein kinase RsbW
VSPDRPVVLTFPPDARYVRVVRLTTSGLASLCGFDLDSIEDLKVAVDEVCSTLIELAGDGEVKVSMAITSPPGLKVEGSVDVRDGGALDEVRADLSQRILDVMADDHSFELANGVAAFSFTRSVDPMGADA